LVPQGVEGEVAVPGNFSLALVELDVLMETLRLGRFVYPYEIPFVGTTQDERRRHRDEVWRALAERGIARDTEPEPDVARILRLWTRPPVLITLEAHEVEQGADYLYRCGWDAKLGLFTQQRGYDLIFEPGSPDDVAPALVHQLPRVPAFRGRSVSVVLPTRPTATPGVFDEGPRSADLGEAQRFFDYPLQRLGRIAITVRDRAGKPHQRSLQWFDSTQGRFLVGEETLDTGERRQTFTPSDGSHLARWMHEHAELAQLR
jgi:hypothetical protein